MHRDHSQSRSRQGSGERRKEWGRMDLEDREFKPHDRERVSSKLRKSDGIHYQEAVHQIRELKSRY